MIVSGSAHSKAELKLKKTASSSDHVSWELGLCKMGILVIITAHNSRVILDYNVLMACTRLFSDLIDIDGPNLLNIDNILKPWSTF